MGYNGRFSTVVVVEGRGGSGYPVGRGGMRPAVHECHRDARSGVRSSAVGRTWIILKGRSAPVGARGGAGGFDATPDGVQRLYNYQLVRR